MFPSQKIFDLIGIGIGPFNLGLAALCHDVPELDCLFIDQNESFNWHRGMMIPGSRLQVPFYADLVTLANPCSHFIYMNYLHHKDHMIRFAILENYYIKRTEYNEYCKWVGSQLQSLQFNTTCTKVEKVRGLYKVETNKGIYFAKHIVLGVGLVPYIPEAGHLIDENVFHSAEYLFHKDRIKEQGSITIVGSGQSAAEIFKDLLRSFEGKLNWFARSSRLFPMDYSKLSLELSTPNYTDYFYNLPEVVKSKIIATQDCLYKGINQSLISEIYNLLSETDSSQVHIHPSCELKQISEELTLTFFHTEVLKNFNVKTNAVILATGYVFVFPEFMDPIKPEINLENGNFKANRNYSVDKANTIFVQNAEQVTHGFNTSDLSLGSYRNAVILNTILNEEFFKIEKGNPFQTFGLPGQPNYTAEL